MAGPAALVTRDKPCAALLAVVLAVSVAFSAEVDSKRRNGTERRTVMRNIGRANILIVCVGQTVPGGDQWLKRGDWSERKRDRAPDTRSRPLWAARCR